MEKKQLAVNTETMVRRLEAWNASLDRQRDEALRASGMPRHLFENLSHTLARIDRQILAGAQQQLEDLITREPEARPAWIQQPAFSELASRFTGQLIRA